MIDISVNIIHGGVATAAPLFFVYAKPIAGEIIVG